MEKISSCLVEAASYQGRVKGATHDFYKYPARFSPVFARAAIESFTVPGNIVLDPFVGGGTTLVEANMLGRSALGADKSSLAVFLTKSKTTVVPESEIKELERWFDDCVDRLNINFHTDVDLGDGFAGYDRNMPWRIKKLCSQYLTELDSLQNTRQKRFARCVLLRCGQWALDCRKEIPNVSQFRYSLGNYFESAVTAMREYRKAVGKAKRDASCKLVNRCVHSGAADIKLAQFGRALTEKADLVVTSPPYPGVHVLYHRWNVQARRETPAPFWLADCNDGHGEAYYTLGGRRDPRLQKYFKGIVDCFSSLKALIKSDGLVIQLVAFSDDDWQLKEFLKSMNDAGYSEVLPEELGLRCTGRLWRKVPGRRWYSAIRGDIPSSKEVVLFHRPTAI